MSQLLDRIEMTLSLDILFVKILLLEATSPAALAERGMRLLCPVGFGALKNSQQERKSQG
jgi:hypothetical protein